MATTTEYLVNDQGRVYKRTINATELNVATLPERLAGNLITRIPRLMTSAWGPVGLVIQNKSYRFTVQLDKLRLKAPFRALENGVLVPDFSPGITDIPIITLDWVPKESWDLKLKLLVQFNQDDIGNYSFVLEWLVATDRANRTFKLPLPNLHDDLHICHGKNAAISNVLGDAFRISMEQFEASQWNDHLWNEPEECQQFFRWKPLKDGFAPIHVDTENWQRYCKKAGVEDVTRYLL